SQGDEPSERLNRAMSHARRSLAEQCDRLVERLLPDATLLGILLEDADLHVMSAGPGRVYLRRSGSPERLTSRDESEAGLLKARPLVCRTAIEPGDLLMAGSTTAFSMSAIAKTTSVL